MNPSTSNQSSNRSGNTAASDAAESTLRLVASLSAPDGLEERVQAALKSAPRAGQILAWPTLARPVSGWGRAAAAAAICFVVAGGGWGVVARLQPGQAGSAKGPGLASPAGLSSSGAMRTPQTLHRPVVPAAVANPVIATAQSAQPVHHRNKPSAAGKVVAQSIPGEAK